MPRQLHLALACMQAPVDLQLRAAGLLALLPTRLGTIFVRLQNFLKPTLLVGLFAPPEELSAGAGPEHG